VCDTIGSVGLTWAERHRSQIFMSAFIVSLLTLFIIGTTACSILTVAGIVHSVPFMQGTITLTNSTSGTASSFDYYAGLNSVVVDGCTGSFKGAACPAHSQLWQTFDCGDLLENCDECGDVASQTIVPVMIALITQLPQIMGDLQRSTVEGDFQCMKV
jgi:hypothetical protein